jgi:hypothetical protein
MNEGTKGLMEMKGGHGDEDKKEVIPVEFDLLFCNSSEGPKL